MIGTLRSVVLDAPDITRLATFYGELTGWHQQYTDEEWITMTTSDGFRVAFQRAPDHVRPEWPSPTAPQQAHLDLRVPDIAAAATRAEELGATVLRKNDRWITLADPAGHPFDLCLNADDPNTTLMGVMLDCPDAKALSSFYSQLLGKPVTFEGDGMAMIGEDGAQPVLFQQVDGYVPPSWPDPAHPQQFHFDIRVDDIETAEQSTLALGATRLPGEGDNWRVYADPAGKPFCLVWNVS